MVNIHLAKSIRRQKWQYLDDGNQPEHIDPPPPPSKTIISSPHSWIVKRINTKTYFCTEIPVQIVSDLHLDLFFPRPGAIGVQPGYTVFECAPSARILALLGDIGIAAHGGLYEFLQRQLYKYRHIFYVMGTHEGYQSTYVSFPESVITNNPVLMMLRIRQEKNYKTFRARCARSDFLTQPWAHSISSIRHVLTSQRTSLFLVVHCGLLSLHPLQT